MSEFCNVCAKKYFNAPSDFKGIQPKEFTDSGMYTVVLCQGCGMIMVDHNGKRISDKMRVRKRIKGYTSQKKKHE